MNVALTLSKKGEAMLVYDQPLGFDPAWVESADDGTGVRIIGEEGEEFLAGILYNNLLSDIEHLQDVILVRMESGAPAETRSVAFINQHYGDWGNV